MTGHRIALRVAVVAALGATLLTALPSPAYADHQVRLGTIGNIELRVGGGAQSVTLRVENQNQGDHSSEDGVARNVSLTLTVPLTELQVHIASAPPECALASNNTRMDCAIAEIAPGATWTGVVQIAVHGNSQLQAGETRNGTAQAILTSHGGQSQTFNVRLQGPDRPPAVAEVTGFVTDESTGERIEGASVLLVDSQNAEFTTTTNANGEFRFAGENIAPGGLGLRARKEGYEGRSSTHTARAGESLGPIQLTLLSTATPTPTPDPTPTPSAAATASPTASPVAAPVEPVDTGMSFFTRLMILLGVIFLLLGVGAIALLLYRRHRERLEDDGDGLAGAGDPTSGPPGPQPRPGSHGVYRPTPTQVATRAGGMGAQPTALIARQGGMADAPTMLHPRAGAADAAETTLLPRAGDPPGPRPPVPGTPPPPRPAAPTYGRPGYAGQPYGSPVPPSGPAPGSGQPYGPTSGSGYGGQAPEYGATQEYGGAAYGGGQAQGPGGTAGHGYRGPSGQSYGAADRAAPPASYPPARHERPAPDAGSYGPDPYTSQAEPGYRGYEQPAHGYPDSAGYQPKPAGYDQAGYGQPGYEPGGYGQPGYDQAGYGQTSHGQPGYDQGGYQPGGHEPAGRHQPNDGYAAGGYEPTSGYGEAGYDRGQGGQPGYGAEPGYDPTSGYGPTAGHDPDGQAPRHGAPPERRRLDWLDN